MARPALDARSAWSHVADELAHELAEPRAPVRLDVRPFAPITGAALGAVDGGSAVVLEGSGIAVGAARAAGLVWRDHAAAHEAPAPLEVRLLDESLAAEVARALSGLAPAEGPKALLERLRTLREAERALDLLAHLRAGDVLALDGGLARRDWPPQVTRTLREACRARGVRLAGVCKSSDVRLAGQPALLAASRAARGVPEPWFAPLPAPPGEAHVAVRWLRGGRVFKVELPPDADAPEALGRLAPWTRDAGYPGYPYPLALAHNRCALDEALVEDLAQALRGLAAERGVDAASWEEAFGDFHEVLDRGL